MRSGVESGRTVPVLSVGVPVFNGEAFLARALQSLHDQDFDALEVIICDNASSDGTEEIARSFVADDHRFSYHRSDRNRGAAWNFNRAFGLARGRYFKWAAADDECRPALARLCVEALEHGPSDTVLCYPKTVIIDEDSDVLQPFEDDLALGEPLPHQRLARLLRCTTEYHPVFGVVRTDVLRRTRLIDTFVASDIALLGELALAGKFIEVPERLFSRRMHAATSVRANPRPEDRATWFDPKSGGRAVLPLARLTAALVGSVHRSGIVRAEQRRCLAVIARDWVRPRWRDLAGEAKHAVIVTGRRSLGPAQKVTAA